MFGGGDTTKRFSPCDFSKASLAYADFSGCKLHIDDTFHEQTARMPSRIELLSAANVRHKRSRAARREKLAKVTT